MIASNIFKIFTQEKDLFYDAVEYQNIPVDEVFKGEYSYGPKEEQILKKNIIINFFQTLLSRLFQKFVYPESCKKLDQNRVLKTKHQLKAVGGKFLSLKTPDGDKIEGIHLKASDFKDSIKKYFYIFNERDTFFSSTEKFLTLRDRFCIKEQKKGCIFSYAYRTPNPEAKQFIEHLEGLKFTNLCSFTSLPDEDANSARKTKIDYLRSLFVSQEYGYNLPLYSLPQQIKPLPTIDENRASSPTVIIIGGNNTTYGNYKDLAVHYLMRGINVMMINPRGYGNSTGTPTSHKTKLDLETAYQYLSKNKKVENKDILVHGHCIGGGIVTDLAARRKGINLLLDRSFSTFHDQAEHIAISYIKNPKKILIKIFSNYGELIEKILPDKYNKETTWGKIRNKISIYAEQNKTAEKLNCLFTKVISWCVDYDSISNLKKTTGKIALVIDHNDDYIKKDAGSKQEASCANKKIIYTNVGHSRSWLKTDRSPSWIDAVEPISTNFDFSKNFNQFLLEANLYRKIF